jgi:hypothetical protein
MSNKNDSYEIMGCCNLCGNLFLLSVVVDGYLYTIDFIDKDKTKTSTVNFKLNKLVCLHCHKKLEKNKRWWLKFATPVQP